MSKITQITKIKESAQKVFFAYHGLSLLKNNLISHSDNEIKIQIGEYTLIFTIDRNQKLILQNSNQYSFSLPNTEDSHDSSSLFTDEEKVAIIKKITDNDLELEQDKNGQLCFATFIKKGDVQHKIGGADKIDLYDLHKENLWKIIKNIHMLEAQKPKEQRTGFLNKLYQMFVKDETDSNNAIFIPMATGSGKTFTQALWYMVLNFADIKSIFTTPDASLKSQMQKDFLRLLPQSLVDDIAPGAVGDQDHLLMTHEDILYDPNNWQRLRDSNEEIFIAFDEQHEITDELGSRRLSVLNEKFNLMLLSATPQKHAYQFAKDGIVLGLSKKDKIEKGISIPAEAKAVKTKNITEKDKIIKTLDIKSKISLAIIDSIVEDRVSPVHDLIDEMTYGVSFKKDDEIEKPQKSGTGQSIDRIKKVREFLRWNLFMAAGEKSLILTESEEDMINLSNYLLQDDQYAYKKGNKINRRQAYDFLHLLDYGAGEPDKLVKKDYIQALRAAKLEKIKEFIKNNLSDSYIDAHEIEKVINIPSSNSDALNQKMLHGLIDFTLSFITGKSPNELEEARYKDFSGLKESILQSIRDNDFQNNWKKDFFAKYSFYKLDHNNNILKNENGKPIINNKNGFDLTTLEILRGAVDEVITKISNDDQNQDIVIDNWSADKKLFKLFTLQKDNYAPKSNDFKKIKEFFDKQKLLFLQKKGKDTSILTSFTESSQKLELAAELKKDDRELIQYEMLNPNVMQYNYTPQEFKLDYSYDAEAREQIADNLFKAGLVGVYVAPKFVGFNDISLNNVGYIIDSTTGASNNPFRIIQSEGRNRGLWYTKKEGKNVTLKTPFFTLATDQGVKQSFDLQHLTEADYITPAFDSLKIYSENITLQLAKDIVRLIKKEITREIKHDGSIDQENLNKEFFKIILDHYDRLYELNHFDSKKTNSQFHKILKNVHSLMKNDVKTLRKDKDTSLASHIMIKLFSLLSTIILIFPRIKNYFTMYMKSNVAKNTEMSERTENLIFERFDTLLQALVYPRLNDLIHDKEIIEKVKNTFRKLVNDGSLERKDLTKIINEAFIENTELLYILRSIKDAQIVNTHNIYDILIKALSKIEGCKELVEYLDIIAARVNNRHIPNAYVRNELDKETLDKISNFLSSVPEITSTKAAQQEMGENIYKKIIKKLSFEDTVINGAELRSYASKYLEDDLNALINLIQKDPQDLIDEDAKKEYGAILKDKILPYFVRRFTDKVQTDIDKSLQNISYVEFTNMAIKFGTNNKNIDISDDEDLDKLFKEIILPVLFENKELKDYIENLKKSNDKPIIKDKDPLSAFLEIDSLAIKHTKITEIFKDIITPIMLGKFNAVHRDNINSLINNNADLEKDFVEFYRNNQYLLESIMNSDQLTKFDDLFTKIFLPIIQKNQCIQQYIENNNNIYSELNFEEVGNNINEILSNINQETQAYINKGSEIKNSLDKKFYTLQEQFDQITDAVQKLQTPESNVGMLTGIGAILGIDNTIKQAFSQQIAPALVEILANNDDERLFLQKIFKYSGWDKAIISNKDLLSSETDHIKILNILASNVLKQKPADLEQFNKIITNFNKAKFFTDKIAEMLIFDCKNQQQKQDSEELIRLFDKYDLCNLKLLGSLSDYSPENIISLIQNKAKEAIVNKDDLNKLILLTSKLSKNNIQYYFASKTILLQNKSINEALKLKNSLENIALEELQDALQKWHQNYHKDEDFEVIAGKMSDPAFLNNELANIVACLNNKPDVMNEFNKNPLYQLLQQQYYLENIAQSEDLLIGILIESSKIILDSINLQSSKRLKDLKVHELTKKDYQDALEKYITQEYPNMTKEVAVKTIIEYLQQDQEKAINIFSDVLVCSRLFKDKPGKDTIKEHITQAACFKLKEAQVLLSKKQDSMQKNQNSTFIAQSIFNRVNKYFGEKGPVKAFGFFINIFTESELDYLINCVKTNDTDIKAKDIFEFLQDIKKLSANQKDKQFQEQFQDKYLLVDYNKQNFADTKFNKILEIYKNIVEEVYRSQLYYNHLDIEGNLDSNPTSPKTISDIQDKHGMYQLKIYTIHIAGDIVYSPLEQAFSLRYLPCVFNVTPKQEEYDERKTREERAILINHLANKVLKSMIGRNGKGQSNDVMEFVREFSSITSFSSKEIESPDHIHRNPTDLIREKLKLRETHKDCVNNFFRN